MPFPDQLGPVQIRAVARRLGPLAEEVVFLGGAAVPLLITDPVAPPFRPTRDVDAVVEGLSRRSYNEVESRLRKLGFANDVTPGAPLCRWRVDGIIVDIMPEAPDILGFSNPWYPHVLRSAWAYSFSVEEKVRVVSAPAFLATKWAAFLDRAQGTDYAGSHDLEDILTVVDGRAEIVTEAARAEASVRSALREAFGHLLAEDRFLNTLPGLIEPGRDPIVLSRLRGLAAG